MKIDEAFEMLEEMRNTNQKNFDESMVRMKKLGTKIKELKGKIAAMKLKKQSD